MNVFARNVLPGAILSGVCCGTVMAGQWTNKNPFAKIASAKPLVDQPGVEAHNAAPAFQQ
ncbi:MAG: hypothetical protein ACREC0_05560 [Methylocella sp.]